LHDTYAYDNVSAVTVELVPTKIALYERGKNEWTRIICFNRLELIDLAKVEVH